MRLAHPLVVVVVVVAVVWVEGGGGWGECVDVEDRETFAW